CRGRIMDRATQSGAPGDQAGLRASLCRHLTYSMGTTLEQASAQEVFRAVALTVRDRMIDRLLATERHYQSAAAKRVYYLSLEFLIGRSLTNNLINLGLRDECREIVKDLGFNLDEVEDTEVDAALGNGGLGRLAACFLDSLATLGLPGFGYGIRYEFGIFHQDIVGGYQVERADEWLKFGTPWEIIRPEKTVAVRFFGHVEHHEGADGKPVARWVGGK